jgi:hypothetical protein
MEVMKKRMYLFICCAALMAFQSVSLAIIEPVTYSFYCVTDTNSTNAATGEAQLSVIVSNGGNQVTFTFVNDALGLPCVISEIYFDDGDLLEIDHIVDNPPDVDFQHDKVTPKQMPGSNLVNPEFVAIESFSVEPENPSPEHGVGPGEQVQVIFNLKEGKTAQDVLDELANGSLRIGMHVIAFGNCDGSESFVNTPEPTTIALLGLGMLVLIGKRREA